jgi:hypothetical protein
MTRMGDADQGGSSNGTVEQLPYPPLSASVIRVIVLNHTAKGARVIVVNDAAIA